MGDMTPTVVVLDGEQRAALAVVRSLGRRGCQVHVGSSDRMSLSGGSRYAASETLLPDPFTNSEAFASAVRQLQRNRLATVVLPVSEASTLALLERRDLFPDTSIPTSDLARFLRASDKAAVLGIAPNLGIAVPQQWTITTDAISLEDFHGYEFPVVVKSSRSVAGPVGDRYKGGVAYANSPQQLREVLSRMGSRGASLLIQQRIEGPGLGVFLLRWGGEIVASFAHQRIREKPPSGGVSVCCESVALPSELLRQSTALLEALDWNGVAMIEFKRDIRTGRDYLMEINPRFWGSLQLAVDAGVDFPWHLLQVTIGQPSAPVHEWQIGARSRWVMGELDHLIARLRRSRAELDLPVNAPGLLRAASSVLIPWRPRQRNDVLRLSDPVPAVREAIAWFRAR